MRQYFHLFFFVLYAFICYQDSQFIAGEHLPIPGVFFSKFVWLTIVGLYTQTLYHLVGFFISTFSPDRKYPAYDFVSQVIAGPVGVAAAFLFWGLFLLDPNNLTNDEVGRILISRNLFNHGLHTLPLISTHLDLFVWKHSQFSKSTAFKGIAIFSTFYTIDLLYVHSVTGFWAYPILGHLSFPIRCIFFASCAFFIFLCHLWLTVYHSLVHGGNTKKTKTI